MKKEERRRGGERGRTRVSYDTGIVIARPDCKTSGRRGWRVAKGESLGRRHGRNGASQLLRPHSGWSATQIM